MVKELFHMARVAQKENCLPGFRAQQWYFFGVATFYLYVRWGTGAGAAGGRGRRWHLGVRSGLLGQAGRQAGTRAGRPAQSRQRQRRSAAKSRGGISSARSSRGGERQRSWQRRGRRRQGGAALTPLYCGLALV
jgi:hypothetical protein